MPLVNDGLNKLMEECGELTQIAAKKASYMHTDEHPDGAGSMKKRMEDEIADVLAACRVVIANFGLDPMRIDERFHQKVQTFQRWHADPTS